MTDRPDSLPTGGMPLRRSTAAPQAEEASSPGARSAVNPRASEAMRGAGLLDSPEGTASGSRAVPGWSAVHAASTPPPPGRDGAWSFPLTGHGWPVRGFAPGPQRWSAGHRGVDLAGTAGQPVLAAASGTVTFSSGIAGVPVVVVEHAGLRTTYQPVAAGLPVGSVVRRGDPIGRLSQAGSHCAPAACLHWGLLNGTIYLDPLSLVSPRPVRLLTLGTPPTAPAATW